MKLWGVIPMLYEPSYSAVEQGERVAFDSGAFHTFDRSQLVFDRDAGQSAAPCARVGRTVQREE